MPSAPSGSTLKARSDTSSRAGASGDRAGGTGAGRKSRVFYLLITAAWLLLAELILITVIRGGFPRPLGTVGGWVSFVVTLLLLATFSWRELSYRREEARQLRQHEETLAALTALTEPLLRPVPVDGLLREMVARMRVLFEVDIAGIYLTEGEGRRLLLRAVDGIAGSDGIARTDRTDAEANGTVPLVDEDVVRRIAANRRPTMWALDGTPAGAASSPGLARAAGCPLVAADRVIGVGVIGSTRPRDFSDRDMRLFQVVSNHVAVRIERARLDEAERASRLAAEHARRQISVLSRAGGLLATAIQDYRPGLEALVDVVVPEFADWCFVDFAERGTPPERVAFRHGEIRSVHDGGDGKACHPEWEQLWEQALRSGRPQLSTGERTDAAGDAGPGGPARPPAEPALERASCMVAPIRVGGLALGAVTFASDPGRPRYRPSDLSVAAEVAGRVSVAVERVLLYREVSEAGHASAKTATQLRQLVEASLNLQRLRSAADILSVVAAAAQNVLGADLSVVTGTVGPNERVRAVARRGAAVVCRPLKDSEVQVGLPDDLDDLDERGARREGWLSVPLNNPDGTTRGAIAVTRHGVVGADDQAVAVLLGQLASAALDARDQYRTAERRQDRWRAVIEATPAAIVEMAPSGRVVLWNRSAAHLFGWPEYREQPGAPDVAPAFLPATAAALSALRDRTLAGEEMVDAELSVEVAQGMIRDLRASIAPLSSDGALYGMLMLATDITEHNRFQENVLRAEQMEALGQVAGGVAHDFNNLLTVISGYTDLLSRKSHLASDDRELLNGIATAADRASVFTRQLLAISRREVTNPVVVAPDAAMQSLGEVLERILGVDVALEWSLDPAAGHIRIDPGRFEQVILNLAINARDAMPHGGSFTISTDVVAPDARQMQRLGLPPLRHVRITFTDTGAGMDEETRIRCFEPFFTTKERVKGTGLGLAAVHSIVAESEGHIEVSSQPGVGTSFELYFPRVDQSVAPAPPEPKVHRRPASEIVLVVEDQTEVRNLIRRVLERDGYLVLEAVGGPEALQIAQQWEGPIELLITDVVMPGMRGPEVATAVKALRPSIKVLFTSAYSHGTILPDGVEGEPATLLQKPFKPSELIAQVRSLLDQRRRRLVRSDSPPPGPS